MTAFARQEADTEFGSLAWEIRSLNHRYLELGVRLPEELRAMESTVRQRVNARLGRGKVECSCRFRPVTAGTAPVDVDRDNLARVLAACEEVSDRLPQAVPLNPLELLRWPGVLREELVDTGPLKQAALALLDKTLDDLLLSRGREGEQIKSILLQRCDDMSKLVMQARTCLPEIRAGLREKLETRLADIDVSADPGRLEQELVIQLQKIDVDEEMDRLESHIGEVRRVLSRKEPVGRRLDFLMQELNREANTLGSKSVVTETSNISVELKVLIEQMREQVQNLE
ncbi:MAG: YicC/YloC family endoribonuclease [Gammaproteobacteria bacterium]|nr:YicC/YloC family endoribonuclease [Gammaproteobacteria bacterium]